MNNLMHLSARKGGEKMSWSKAKLIGMVGLVGLLVCMAVGTASADTLYVPSASYATIQAAIDAASPSDTVAVASGEYSGDPLLSAVIKRGSSSGPLLRIR